VTLRAATFGPGGFDLAVPAHPSAGCSTLLSRDGSELASCSNQPATRLDGNQPAQGLRPVYKVSVGDMCWLWHRVALENIEQVNLSIDRVAWRFSDDAKGAVVRPRPARPASSRSMAIPARGHLLARLPLAPVVRGEGKTNSTQEFHVEAECCS